MKKLILAALAATLAFPVFASAATEERHLSTEALLALKQGVLCRNETGGTIAANSLVYASGWDEATQRWLVTKADSDVAGARAEFIVLQSIPTNYDGECPATATLYNLNTNGSSEGAPVYLSTTAGSYTLTAPTAANAISQIVGRVRKVSSTLGVIEIDLRKAIPQKVGTNEIQPGGIGEANLGITVRASTNIGVGDLVYLSSYHLTDGFVAAIADADVVGADAAYVASAAITSGATGTVYKAATVAMNTTGASVGDPVYLTVTGTTTNTKSLTPPSGEDDRIQIVGRVVVHNSASGSVAINLGSLPTTYITGTQIVDASIAEADLKAVDAASDEDVFTYEATTGDFEWHSVAEILGQATEGALANSTILTADIKDGEIGNADISASADIARSKLGEDPLAIFAIPISDIRIETFQPLTYAEDADSFNLSYSANVVKLLGEVTDNEPETSVGTFQFRLPPEYVAAGDVSVRFHCAIAVIGGAPVDNASSFDLSCYEQSGGAVGGDIVSTAAVSFAALGTYYDKDFALTATDLIAGDLVNCTFTAVIVDSEAGAGSMQFSSDPPVVLADIKG